MSHLGKPLGEVLLNDASHRYWGDVSASVLNLSLSSQGQEKIWCFFSISINSDDITSPPSLLWWDDISNLGSISSRTNWHWFFFFFLFLSSFPEDSANSQSKGSDNSLAKNLLRWFFCPHRENLGQPDRSAPLCRLQLCGSGSRLPSQCLLSSRLRSHGGVCSLWF